MIKLESKKSRKNATAPGPPSQTYPYPDAEGISESGPRWNRRLPLLRFIKVSNMPPLLALGLVSIGPFENLRISSFGFEHSSFPTRKSAPSSHSIIQDDVKVLAIFERHHNRSPIDPNDFVQRPCCRRNSLLVSALPNMWLSDNANNYGDVFGGSRDSFL